jgi:hypothetical protein
MNDERRDDLEETVDMPVPDDTDEAQEELREAAEADDTLPPGSEPPDEP